MPLSSGRLFSGSDSDHCGKALMSLGNTGAPFCVAPGVLETILFTMSRSSSTLLASMFVIVRGQCS